MYFSPLNYWPKRYWPQGYWPAPTPNTVTVNAVALSGAAQALVVAPGTAATVLATVYGTLAAETLVIAPGAASVLLDALAAAIAAQAVDVTGVTIDHTILLAALQLTGVARHLTVRPGPMVIGLESVGMTAETYRMMIFALLGCAIAAARARADATVGNRQTMFADVNDRTGCQ